MLNRGNLIIGNNSDNWELISQSDFFTTDVIPLTTKQTSGWGFSGQRDSTLGCLYFNSGTHKASGYNFNITKETKIIFDAEIYELGTNNYGGGAGSELICNIRSQNSKLYIRTDNNSNFYEQNVTLPRRAIIEVTRNPSTNVNTYKVTNKNTGILQLEGSFTKSISNNLDMVIARDQTGSYRLYSVKIYTKE